VTAVDLAGAAYGIERGWVQPLVRRRLGERHPVCQRRLLLTGLALQDRGAPEQGVEVAGLHSQRAVERPEGGVEIAQGAAGGGQVQPGRHIPIVLLHRPPEQIAGAGRVARLQRGPPLQRETCRRAFRRSLLHSNFR
jgi:hypothetical protein